MLKQIKASQFPFGGLDEPAFRSNFVRTRELDDQNTKKLWWWGCFQEDKITVHIKFNSILRLKLHFA